MNSKELPSLKSIGRTHVHYILPNWPKRRIMFSLYFMTQLVITKLNYSIVDPKYMLNGAYTFKPYVGNQWKLPKNIQVGKYLLRSPKLKRWFSLIWCENFELYCVIGVSQTVWEFKKYCFTYIKLNGTNRKAEILRIQMSKWVPITWALNNPQNHECTAGLHWQFHS